MICWSICLWISDGFWSHFWCFFQTFTIRTCNLLNHQKPLFFQWISMILLFRETWFLMIFLIFSVTSFSIYFFRQKDAKMDPKNYQNGSKNHPDAGFLRFWGVSEGWYFSMIFWSAKKSPNIWKNPILWAEMGAKTSKMARPGGMRGASGEVRRGLEPLRVRQESGQELKT